MSDSLSLLATFVATGGNYIATISYFRHLAFAKWIKNAGIGNFEQNGLTLKVLEKKVHLASKISEQPQTRRPIATVWDNAALIELIFV